MLWVRAYGTDYCDAGLATPQVHSQNFLTVIISLIKVFFDASHFSACHETLEFYCGPGLGVLLTQCLAQYLYIS